MDIQAWLQGTEDRRPPDQHTDASHSDDRIFSPTRHPQRRLDRGVNDHSRRRRGTAFDRSVTSDEEQPSSHSLISNEQDATSSSSGRYQRRKRHKTRADRYELKTSKRRRDERHVERKIPARRSRRNDPEAAMGVVRSFELNSKAKERRLTLEPTRQAGLFTHGRSARVAAGGEGLPDLSFNELKFLQRPRVENVDIQPGDVNRQSRQQDAEISQYFIAREDPAGDDVSTRDEAHNAMPARSQTSIILSQVAKDSNLLGRQTEIQDQTINLESPGRPNFAQTPASTTSMPLPGHPVSRKTALPEPYQHQLGPDSRMSHKRKSKHVHSGQHSSSLRVPTTTRRRDERIVSVADQLSDNIRPYARIETSQSTPHLRRQQTGFAECSPQALSNTDALFTPDARRGAQQYKHDNRPGTAAAPMPRELLRNKHIPDKGSQHHNNLARTRPVRLPTRQLCSFGPDVRLATTATVAEPRASASKTMLWQAASSSVSAGITNTVSFDGFRMPEQREAIGQENLIPLSTPDGRQNVLSPPMLSETDDLRWQMHAKNHAFEDTLETSMPSFDIKDFWRPNRLY